MIESLNHVAESWWGWMWATTWQVSLLIVVIGVIDLAIRKWAWPQVRYTLWLMVIVKLLLPPTFALPTSIAAQFLPAPIVEEREMATPSTALSASVVRPTIATTAGSSAARRHPSTSVGPTVPSPEPSSLEGSRLIPSVVLSGLSYAMLIWLFCALTLAAYLMMRLRHLHREALSGTDDSLPPWLPQLLAESSARLRLRSPPRVLVSRHTASPAVLGTFRPILLLPQDGLSRLSPERAKHVLLHELAHIKRGDLIIHAAYLIIQIIYWFNPLLWVVRRQMRRLREICCDATVANVLREETASYRQTLLETARELLVRPKADPGLGLLGIGEHGNCLRERLRWLERNTWKYTRLRKGVTAMIATLVFVGLLPMATAQVGRTPQEGGSSQSPGKGARHPNGDKEQFQTLISGLADAVLQDDRVTAAGFISDDQRVGSVMHDMKESIDLGATPTAVQTVVMGEGRAVVITDFFQFADSRYRGKQCLVFTMLRSGDKWLIDDIDLEGVQGLVETVRRFEKAKSLRPSTHRATLGLEGFCPVTAVETGEWQQGDRQWGAVHDGRTYLFVSREKQERFLSAPDRFAPALAGCDPVVFVETSSLVDGKRQHGLLRDDSYFLFVDDGSRTRFEADPERYLRGIREVDLESLALNSNGIETEESPPPPTENTQVPTSALEAITLSDAVREFNKQHGNHPVGKTQPPLTEDEVIASIRWALRERVSLSEADLHELKKIVADRRLTKGWQFEVMTDFELIDGQHLRAWSIRLSLLRPDEKGCSHSIRHRWLTLLENGRPVELPSNDYSLDSLDGCLPLFVALDDFNTIHRSLGGQEQPPLTEEEVIAAIRWWSTKRDDAPVSDLRFEQFVEIAENRKLPKDAAFELLGSFKNFDGFDHDYLIWSVRLKMPRISTPGGGTFAFKIREQFVRARAPKTRFGVRVD